MWGKPQAHIWGYTPVWSKMKHRPQKLNLVSGKCSCHTCGVCMCVYVCVHACTDDSYQGSKIEHVISVLSLAILCLNSV